MRLILRSKGNIYNLMRQAGYYFERPASAEATAGKEENKELVFIRPLGSPASGYPRFHIYIKVSRATVINLHLDQKKPIYKGTPAHAAEYEGEVVEKEAERIKKIAGL